MRYTPAVTIVAAWINAETGVGPAMASGSHTYSGICADFPVQPPRRLDAGLPDWTYTMLRDLAWDNQPQIAAALIRTQATRWGVEIARLRRRPDLAFSASWYAIDDNRPASPIVDVGRDAWSIGAQMSVPLWHHKYDAIRQEANWRHAASHASVEETRQHYDSLIRDLWEQARSANDTLVLYRDTILPDAQQNLDVDVAAYRDGSVEFDRVIGDFRTVLTLDLGLHRAKGELATALARIRQAAGVDLGVPSGDAEPSNRPPAGSHGSGD